MTPTLRNERTMLRWRARAFVRQPLVTTIIGVVVSVMLYVVAYNVVSATQCDPALNAGMRGLCEIFSTVQTFPVLLIGVLITGWVAGLVSHDSGQALRAVLAGVMVPLLIFGVALVLPETFARAAKVSTPWKPTFGDYVGATVGGLGIGAGVGLVLLIPAALAFREGRRIRRNRQSKRGGPAGR
jgi:hypothetical protein